MEGRPITKSAISISLDHNVLAFFSGKDRSARINHVLKQYIRWNLGDKSDSMFVDDKTDRELFAPAIYVCQKQYGDRDAITKIMQAIFEVIE